MIPYVYVRITSFPRWPESATKNGRTLVMSSIHSVAAKSAAYSPESSKGSGHLSARLLVLQTNVRNYADSSGSAFENKHPLIFSVITWTSVSIKLTPSYAARDSSISFFKTYLRQRDKGRMTVYLRPSASTNSALPTD